MKLGNVRSAIAFVALMGVFGSAGPAAAGALVFTFDQDACSSPGCGLANYGTVTLTDLSPGMVDVKVLLLGGSGLIHSGALDDYSLIFNLPGTATIAGLPSGWGYTHTTYIAKGNMFGTFDYEINCGSMCAPNNPWTDPLEFTVSEAGIDVNSFADGGTNTDTYFVADISNPNGGRALTGRIGASYTGVPTIPAPEPVTMSLFGMGLAGMAVLRRRKSKV